MKKILLTLIFLLILAGCGDSIFHGIEDKNSKSATDLEVTKRLDSRDYDWILSNPDKANATDYSAAAMGKAGLDPVEVIKKLNNISQQTAKNDLGAVTSLAIQPDALNELQTAKKKLKEELGIANKPTNTDMDIEKGFASVNNSPLSKPTDSDLYFQLVMTSFTSTITAIAQVGQNNASYISGGFDASNGISEIEAKALANYIAMNPTVKVDTNGDKTPDTELVTIIVKDVVDIATYLPKANLGTGSDINTVLTRATQGAKSIDYDGDGTVTSIDISNYLNCVVGKGC